MPFHALNPFARGKPVHPETDVHRNVFHHPDSPYLLQTTPFQRFLERNLFWLCLMAVGCALLTLLMADAWRGGWALMVAGIFCVCAPFCAPKPVDAAPAYAIIVLFGGITFIISVPILAGAWLN